MTLQQETAKSQTLAHPNIVTVYDFDRDGETLFMTMELLEGEPLDKLLKAHGGLGLPKTQALALAQDMGAALAYAHQRQLIHADFKPGNVFVTAEGRAKVLDFGIARAAAEGSQKFHFDAGSLGSLTPACATLEMLRGEPTSYADDVYALACVVYEMLSGQHHYERQSAQKALDLKLKPKRLELLSSAQWRALSRGLALEKANRSATIDQFLGELFPKRGGFTKIALAAVGISLCGAAWFGYQQYAEKYKIEITINQKLDAAQSCFARSDFSCAGEQSAVAASLDSTNTQAAALLKNSQLGLQQQQKSQHLASLLAAGEACLQQMDYACAQVKARELLEMEPTNSQATELLRKAEQLNATQQISGLIQQAEDCLAKNDLDCALLVSQQVDDINKQHPDAQALARKVQNAQLQTQNLQNAAAQKLQSLIAAAQKCLMEHKYDCALAQATNAPQLNTSSPQAVEVKQAALLAKQQQAEAESKVASLLEQAQVCLDKKNYSCAIAKSEAALDLIPQHPAALSIRNTAQDTQRRLKESGFNIK